MYKYISEKKSAINETNRKVVTHHAASEKPILFQNPSLQASPIQRVLTESQYRDLKKFNEQWRRFEKSGKIKPKHTLSDSEIEFIYNLAKSSFVDFEIAELFNKRADIKNHIRAREISDGKQEASNQHAIEKHIAVDEEYLRERLKNENRVDFASKFTSKSKSVNAVKNWLENGPKILEEYGRSLGYEFYETIKTMQFNQEAMTDLNVRQHTENVLMTPVKLDGYTLSLQRRPAPRKEHGVWRIACKWVATTEQTFGKLGISKSHPSSSQYYSESATIYPPNDTDLMVLVNPDNGEVDVEVPGDVLGTFF